MKLVGPEHISQEDKEVQRVFQEHPLVAERVKRITHGYHELVSLCIECMLRGDTDTGDIQRSLAKKQNALYCMGIPYPTTETAHVDLVCSFHLPDGTMLYAHTECSLDPLWDEPPWDDFILVPLESLPQDTTCCACERLLIAEPPFIWNKMTYGEVYRTIRTHEQKEKTNDR